MLNMPKVLGRARDRAIPSKDLQNYAQYQINSTKQFL